MQSKGAIKLSAIIFILICIYQLSFTFFTSRVENKADEYARKPQVSELANQLSAGNEVLNKIKKDSISRAMEYFYLDSMSNIEVFKLGIRNYTYKECKEREINLGLDLKGGMNVTLEVSIADIIRAMSGNNQDSIFVKSLALASEMQKNSQEDFVTLFGKAFQQVAPGAKLSSIFNRIELKDKINPLSTNDEVMAVIRQETEGAIDRAFDILRTRIDRFGVAQPNIQKLDMAGRILVELPGIKDPSRVRKLLQGTAQLEFWETYEFKDINNYFIEANSKLALLAAANDTVNKSKKNSPESQIKSDVLATGDTSAQKTLLEKAQSDSVAAEETDQRLAGDDKQNPLFSYMRPAFIQDENGSLYPGNGPVCGYVSIIDTAKVNRMLAQVKSIFPRNLKLLWEVKPFDEKKTTLRLIGIKVSSRDGSAAMDGDVVIDARQDFSQKGSNEISMTMNAKGAQEWKRLTGAHVGESIAIVLDDYVYSFPTVNEEIPNGRSSISGSFTLEEAKDLANILKAGKLPAPARIVEEAVVGPSLGQEAINAGLLSFIIAFILVLVFMPLYYSTAGIVADVVLFFNLFFMFGILASLQAVLTLPGIAGIVLTIGMSVDANVIIFERIKEEVRAGKGIRLAITDGYKNALSAIVDGNVTTLLTGVVLFIFGSGPVQGFATTLIIGILTSLFSGILLSRIIFVALLDRNKNISFDNKVTRGLFSNVDIDFIGKRKTYYVVSAVIIALGLVSLLTRGLNQGVDFTGGRTYVVRFDQNVNTLDVRTALSGVFGEMPEVKTFGPNTQVKVTTKYLIDDNAPQSDSIVEAKLYQGVQGFYKTKLSQKEFLSDKDDKVIGKLSSQKVGPTIADDIKKDAIWAILFALIIIFTYIAARFRKWEYGVGGVVTLIHDALIAISMYSVFYNILPFNLEVDQAFIAAILTIIGYSINDSVIVFDRMREYNTLFPKRELSNNINAAINSTLGRTFMTSGTTVLVLAVIFLLGGEIIRGFSFALIIGIGVGTYSSIFISTPVSYDLAKLKKKRAGSLKKS